MRNGTFAGRRRRIHFADRVCYVTAMRTLFVLCALLAAWPAAAHPLLQNTLWIVFEPERAHLAVNVSLKEITVAQQLGPDADGGFDTEKIAAAAEKHRDYVASHLSLAAEGRALAGEVLKVTPPLLFTSAEQTFYQYEIAYPLRGARPAQIALRHEMLREWPYAAGMAWDVSYSVRSRTGADSEVRTALLRRDETLALATGWAAVPTDSAMHTFADYLRHGVLHILTGYDHLLFVSALVLATLSFWEMFKVVAAFTVAHTLTLALSVFDVVRLPSSFVEPAIAASIVFVALDNVIRPRQSHSRARLAVAFGFGLVHGLGFAGGLLDAMAGLPRIGAWVALAAFSLGVEIGHQAVVLPLFAVLAFGRRKLRDGFQAPALRYGSAAISLCGAYYLFVSLHEQFFAP